MSLVVTSPRLEYGDSKAGNVPLARPRLTWTTQTEAPGWQQEAAEVSLLVDGTTTVAQLDGDRSVLVDWPFPDLKPRARGEVAVRVKDAAGWSPWSAPTAFTASFLGDGEWQAATIGLSDPARYAQPILLRAEFNVRAGLRHATWYATAGGVYQTYVNGAAVDDQILKPGWTPYQFRTVHETTEVTDLLTTGANALGIAASGGWYTGEYGWQGMATPIYGEQPIVAGQLLLEYEDGAREWLLTGDTWKVTGESPWVDAGIYLGEDYDARLEQDGWATAGFDDSGWEAAAVVESLVAPGPRTGPEARVVATLPVAEVTTSPSGATLLDFGQNITGRLRIRVAGEAGDTVTLRHAEVLEDGELGIRPLRLARATDNFTLKGEEVEEYAPMFTFHGFRYAEVSGWPGEFDPAAVTAEVIASDMRRTGWFETSHELLDRLHQNVVWGMVDNFLYLPTDCPQRDERLGWTGDIQIFGPTASFLFDSNGFLASWLQDLWLEQKAAGGGVAFVVPDVLKSGHVPTAAWGDAATVLPSLLRNRFDDRDVLARQFPSMKAWTDLILGRAGARHLWEGGFQFGDWVDPDSPPDNPAKAKTDSDIAASAFLYHSCNLVARAATELGHPEEAEYYATQAELVGAAWLAEYVTPAGRLMSDSQTAYAMALVFGLVGGDLKQIMGDRLAVLVRRDGYRISTGFIGTPLVCDALSMTGHHAEAGRLLLQTECPSWLYPVTMGATTIWERWDALLPDGSINPGEMTSFNHYALGSVADWLHRVVGGLAPAAPGYKKVRIAPRPIGGVDSVTTKHDGPYGPIVVSWAKDGNALTVSAEVPPNSSAVVALPASDEFEVGSGRHEWTVEVNDVARVPFQITAETQLTEVIDDPEALAAVLDAYGRVSGILQEDFKIKTRWLPGQTLGDSFALAAPAVEARVLAELEEFNRTRQP